MKLLFALHCGLVASMRLGGAFHAVEHASPNDGDSIAEMSPEDIRSLWQDGVDVWEQTTDFFQDKEGGKSSIIWEKTDTSKGKGQKIRFTVRSGFYDEPHHGDDRFDEEDDFEQTLIDGHELTVDYLRHAVRNTERMEEVAGMRGEIISGDNDELGKWLGRLKAEMMFMTLLYKVNSENIIYAGGRSLNTLTSTDTLAWDDIVAMGTVMSGLGGLSAMVGKVKGNPIFKQLVVSAKDSLFSLKTDSDYKQLLKDTRNEDAAEKPFNGGYVDIEGHRISEFTPIDHDGVGAIGSPINPQARLGVAVAAGSAALDITGGRNSTNAAIAKKLYFKHFPNHAYKFHNNDILDQDADEHYLLVINPPNAAVDPNKVGMYAYTTGNNGNKITLTKRLGPSDQTGGGGIQHQTIGGVTWNTGDWLADDGPYQGHTQVHPSNALVLPCNALGQTIAPSLMLGRACAYRGYGKWRNRRTQQDLEGGHIMDRFITTVFGQALRKDRIGRVPAVLVLWHAINYPGLPLPTITGS